MTIKKIKKQAEKAAVLSFAKNKLNESIAKKFLKEFSNLAVNEAILSLNFYLKGLKRHLSKNLLIIESTTKLSEAEQKSIREIFKKDFAIEETETKLSPSLLGGFKVRIADTVFDLSIKERIQQVKAAIIN